MPVHTKRGKQTIESLVSPRFTSKLCFHTTGVMRSLKLPTTGEREWKPLQSKIGTQNKPGCFLGNTEQDFYNTGLSERPVALLGVQEDGSLEAYSIHNTALPLKGDCCLRGGSADNSIFVNKHEAVPRQESNLEIMEEETDETVKEENGYWEHSPFGIDVSSERSFAEQNLEDPEEIMAAAVLTSLSLTPTLTKVLSEFPAFAGDENGVEDGVFGAEEKIPCSELSEKGNSRRGKSRKQKNSCKTVFQCTWPRCGKIFPNSAAIIWHVRSCHLGPKDKDDNGFSDGEEEFYFNEIELHPASGHRHSSEGCITSSFPQPRRYRSMSDPSRPTQPLTQPTTPAHKDDNFPRSLRSVGGNRWKPKRVAHQNAHTNNRKGRGDGRKCRKVYGMENRHLWCTQCRWKKACIKFTD